MPKILYMLNCMVKQTENGNFEISLLTAFYEELLKLFIHFGAATKLAFGGKLLSFHSILLPDIIEKTARIRHNQQLLAGKISDDDS